jgi:CBS domain-containing protein
VSKKTRAYIGTLAYDVGTVGQIAGVCDVAFILPERKAISQDIPPLTLATNVPRIEEEVSVVGFPTTPYQQIEKCVVTSIHEKQGFIVLNKPVDPGFSGGPVLNSEGKVYGVITSTDMDKKQTTVIRLTDSMLSSIAWRPFTDYDAINK